MTTHLPIQKTQRYPYLVYRTKPGCQSNVKQKGNTCYADPVIVDTWTLNCKMTDGRSLARIILYKDTANNYLT